jgi:hypothetical protein
MDESGKTRGPDFNTDMGDCIHDILVSVDIAFIIVSCVYLSFRVMLVVFPLSYLGFNQCHVKSHLAD